jgi:hypothetical protein
LYDSSTFPKGAGKYECGSQQRNSQLDLWFIVGGISGSIYTEKDKNKYGIAPEIRFCLPYELMHPFELKFDRFLGF